MVKRRKTKIERWLSFNQHKKRFGANTVQQALKGVDYDALKGSIISGDEVQYTYGSAKDLETHLEALKAEFAGQSELLHYHAKLIVLIRREAHLKENVELFDSLWDHESDYLLEHLNTRWLVSAADTFADHSTNPEDRAYAMACSCLINTIKLNETERYLHHAALNMEDQTRRQKLAEQRVAIFDGVSAFAVGTDDTLRNMRWRLDGLQSTSHCYEILKAIFDRLQSEETVYKRFRDRHTRKKTAWW